MFTLSMTMKNGQSVFGLLSDDSIVTNNTRQFQFLSKKLIKNESVCQKLIDFEKQLINIELNIEDINNEIVQQLEAVNQHFISKISQEGDGLLLDQLQLITKQKYEELLSENAELKTLKLRSRMEESFTKQMKEAIAKMAGY